MCHLAESVVYLHDLLIVYQCPCLLPFYVRNTTLSEVNRCVLTCVLTLGVDLNLPPQKLLQAVKVIMGLEKSIAAWLRSFFIRSEKRFGI